MIDLTTISPTTFAKGTQKGDGTITPLNIVKDMVDLLFKDIGKDKHIKEYKFIDICCKSGNFLREIYVRLMNHPDMVTEYEDKTYRSEYILNNMLYGICFRQTDAMLSTRNVYGRIVSDSHIVCIDGWEELVKTGNDKLTIDTLKERTEFMKFDVVVGNPPYNNDLYLNFVKLARKLAHEEQGKVCMITPAKWQAKGGDKNEAFRRDIVPYMSDIVYYPNEKDIFDISCQGGITYFNLDGHIHINKIINNKEYANWNINYGFDYDIRVESILNKIKSISPSTIIDGTSKFIPTAWWNCTIDLGRDKHRDIYDNSSKYTIVNNNKRVKIREQYIKNTANAELYSLTHSHWVRDIFAGKIYNPFEITDGSTVTLFAGTLVECNSAKSYYECKLIWWLVYYFNNMGGLTTNSFKLVPDPGKFDHIFTDQELYEKYSLTEEEIAVIESVIKERK